MPTQSRKKPPPQTTRDYLATLEHAIRTLSYGYHTFTIFRHFVELSALALSNVADPSNKAAREAQYLAIVKQYKPKRCSSFHPCSACSSRAWSRRRPMCSACSTTGSNCTTTSPASFSRRTHCVRRWPRCSCMMPSAWENTTNIYEHTNPVWAAGRWSLRSRKPYERRVSTTNTGYM